MKRVTVWHNYYGCDSFCCGHTIEIHDENDKLLSQDFTFSHPAMNETPLEFAKDIVAREFGSLHVADLDWDNAKIETSED